MRAFSALAILSLVATSLAAPLITDKASTSLLVHTDPSADPSVAHLSVTVQRVDQLVEDDGTILAAKVVDVTLQFDVDEDTLLVNGVPVEVGVSKIAVESAMIARGAASLVPEETLADAFDVGIAGIEVHVIADNLLLKAEELVAIPISPDTEAIMDRTDVYEVRRFVVAARVISLNGEDVEEKTFVKQTIDMIHDGTILRSSPCSSDALLIVPSADGEGETLIYVDGLDGQDSASASPCGSGHVAGAWARMPHSVRVAVSAFVGSILLLLFLVALPLALYLQYRERREAAHYAALATEESLTNPFDEEHILHDEKAPIVEATPPYSH